ncbi:MAG: hypothetical protein ACE5KJ_05760 [Candidatus Zixiibacteriota bacterium]
MIQVEHLVYGSFSFDSSAQHIPGQSEGISNKIRKEITSFCDSWGECKNFKFYSSLNQIWLDDEPESEPKVAVIKITHHGRDFSGRGGALLRHALVLKERDYEKLDFNPFRVEELSIFRTDWKDGDKCETLFVDLTEPPGEDLSLIPQELYPSIKENLRFFLEGFSLLSYRIINTPTSDLCLRSLFSLIPYSRRKKLALTTFAFRKNYDYQIGCIYSPERIPDDNSSIEFERKAGVSSFGWESKEISDYLDPLFFFLKQGDLLRASAHIKSYSEKIKV